MRPIDAEYLLQKLADIKDKKGKDVLLTMDTVEYVINKMPTLSMKDVEFGIKYQETRVLH